MQSRSFKFKIFFKFYIISEIQSFHRSLITKYHDQSIKTVAMCKKTENLVKVNRFFKNFVNRFSGCKSI